MLEYKFDSMQGGVNTDFRRMMDFAPKMRTKCSNVFSNAVKKCYFYDMTIIFSLKHVFILIVYATEKIMVVGFVFELKSEEPAS